MLQRQILLYIQNRVDQKGQTVSDSTENPAEEETDGPGFPHTPPLGIKAVHPGDEIPGPPDPEQPPRPEREKISWGVVALISLAAIISIIGTFLPWTEARGEFVIREIGWDQPIDALIVLFSGLVAALAGGAILSGIKSHIITLCLFAVGTIHAVLAIIKIFDVENMESTSGYNYSIGVGLPVIIVGGGALIVASFLEWGSRRREQVSS